MSVFPSTILVLLKILTFDIDATPPVGSELAYQTMKASYPLSLRARGVVFFGEDRPVVLCSVDWIGIANESQDTFKKALAEAAGTTPDRVAVHTVHQHDAPICDFTAEKIMKEKGLPNRQFDGEFARELIENLKVTISNRLREAEPVTRIGIGKAKVRKVASSRVVKLKDGSYSTRYSSEPIRSEYRKLDEGVIDNEVSLVSFWNGEKPVAVLSFYATHPQSYYLTGTANPDFPGIARALMELEEPDVLFVHFNGAGGNVSAGKYNDGSHKLRYILARRLEKGMKKAWKHTRLENISRFEWNTTPLLLPPDDKLIGLEDSLLNLSHTQITNMAGQIGWFRRRSQGMAIDAGCLSVNDVRLLFMPGELFVEYQLKAKRMAPDKFVAMAAYGDYGPFYIGTRESYKLGLYETESSPVSEDAEDCIIDAVQRLLDH